MKQDLFKQQAVGVIEQIKRREVTVTDWVRSLAGRIREVDSAVKAWAHFDEEQALVQAALLDKKLQEHGSLDSLWGLPIGVKDIFNTEDMPTRRGSPVYKDYRPTNDARVVAHYRWFNAVIMGKTTTDEFAVHWPAETANPHDLTRTPGGSSSGSAAAVASGMVPVALGSQTLGSTIRPSSYCGIYGLKPTFGLFPRTGMLKTTDTLDNVCLLSRSIADMRFFFDTGRLSGMDYPVIQEKMDLRVLPRFDQRQFRVALLMPPAWVQEEDYARDALMHFVQELGRQGVDVAEVRLPAIFDECPQVHDTVYDTQLAYYFKPEIENHRSELSDWFVEMIERGQKISNESFFAAQKKQNEMTELMERAFASFDVVLSLSSAGEAPVGRFARAKPDTCMMWTLCRGPALSVPAFKGPSGMPLGLQLVGKRYDDITVLDFASKLVSWGMTPEAVDPVISERRAA